MNKIVIIADNLRSSYNVGSLFRTAEGLAVKDIYLTGTTPYPRQSNDNRLPHEANKITSRIYKTSLGAENNLNIYYRDDILDVIEELKINNYSLVGLEQSQTSILLNQFSCPENLAIIIGNEVDGLSLGVMKLMDKIVEIPMLGKKESFNVVVAAAIMLYHCRINKI